MAARTCQVEQYPPPQTQHSPLLNKPLVTTPAMLPSWRAAQHWSTPQLQHQQKPGAVQYVLATPTPHQGREHSGAKMHAR